MHKGSEALVVVTMVLLPLGKMPFQLKLIIIIISCIFQDAMAENLVEMHWQFGGVMVNF
jgi:hypothetical protein